MKHFYLLVLFFCSLPILTPEFILNAQESLIYEQVDTIKIADSPESKIFIFKIDIKDIELEHQQDTLITQIDIYDYSTNSLIQSLIDSSDNYFGSGWVVFVDINLDGYLDLDINLGDYNLISMHSFWLFDKLTNKYYHSPEFSVLNDYYIYPDKKEIETYAQSLGGRGGYWEKYKIDNDSLSLIETGYSNKYDYERQEVINGVLRTVVRDRETEIKDDEGNYLSIIWSSKLVNDSLLLMKKSWLSEVKDLPTDYDLNEIYNCGPWGGCLKYLRKEVYLYDDSIPVYAIKDTVRYQVINDKWERVKDFNK